jgi:hypothetical protein
MSLIQPFLAEGLGAPIKSLESANHFRYIRGKVNFSFSTKKVRTFFPMNPFPAEGI